MRKIVKGLLLLGWTVVIFCLSAQNQSQSAETSGRFTIVLYQILSLFYQGADLKEILLNSVSIIRKLAHFSEFLILGILAYVNLKEYTITHPIIYAGIFSSLYAVSDEIHQLFVENRFCDIKDMLIDSLGAWTGILLCIVIGLLRKRP